MRKRSSTSVRVLAMLAMALVCNMAMAQKNPDQPQKKSPVDCVTNAAGDRVCKTPAGAQSDSGGVDIDIPNGGCWLDEGAWMCESPVR